MANDLDFHSVHPRGDNEKHLGDGILEDATNAFANPTTKHPLRLQMTHRRKWTTSAMPGNPDVIKIVALAEKDHGPKSGNPKDGNSCETGLELRRYARIYRKPTELVYCDPVSKTIRLLAAIDSAPKDGSGATETTTIYSPEPSFRGHAPTDGFADVKRQYNVSSLYPRTRIRTAPSRDFNNYFEYARTMEMVQEPNDGGKSSSDHQVLYQSKEVPGPTGPQTVISKTWNGRTTSAAGMVDSSAPIPKSKTLTVTVAPGIDPSFILCLAADKMKRQAVSDEKSQQSDLLSNLLCLCVVS